MLTWNSTAASGPYRKASCYAVLLAAASVVYCALAQEVSSGYVINLMSTRSPVALQGRLHRDRFLPHSLYVTRVTFNQVMWHRLRLGSFSTREEAEQVMASWKGEFADAWVDQEQASNQGEIQPQTNNFSAAGSPSQSSMHYVVVLQSTRARPSTSELVRFSRIAGQPVFLSEYRNGDGTWFRVSTQGYADKASANLDLKDLQKQFPQAWIKRQTHAIAAKRVAVYEKAAEAPVTLGKLSENIQANDRKSDTETGASRQYVINLRSAPNEFSKAQVSKITPTVDERVYAIQFNKNGQSWYRLRLGPFATEEQARRRLAQVRQMIPGAWIDVAGKLDTDAISSFDSKFLSNATLSEEVEQFTADDSVPVDEALAAGAPNPAETPQLLLYAVVVNGQDFGVTTVLRFDDGRFFVRGIDLDAWGVTRPQTDAYDFAGQMFYDPSGLPGAEIEFDDTRLMMVLGFASSAFYPTRVGGRPLSPTPTPSSLGGFANYDLFASHNNRGADDVTRLEGVFELGGFGPLGAVTSSVLGQDLIAAGADAQSPSFVRLESAYRRDWHDDALTMIAGDSITRGSIWGRSVRFGGGQFARNFAIQPNFVSFPLPSLSGEAVLPSTAELYINESLRQTQNLTPGAFEIIDLPIITGSGEAKLVVTDLLGRQQVIEVPFYASNDLLRAGLSDYSFEAGFVRERFGLQSNDYGRGLLVGTGRYGFTDRFTGEARLEWLDDQTTVGLGGNYVLPFGALFSGALAVSEARQGTGQLASIGIERRSASGFTLRAFSQYATRDFTQLGQAQDLLPSRLRVNANLGYARLGPGSPSINYALDDNWDGTRRELVSGFYSFPFYKRGAVSFFATKSLEQPRTLSWGLTLVHRFGNRDTLVASYNNNDGFDEGSVEVQRSLPVGEGFGYRMQVDAFGDANRQEAEGFWRTSIGTYSAGISHTPGSSAYRLSADGGIAVLGGDAKLMRPIEDSFAKVKVDEYENVGVFLNNQEIARTDAQGVAWLPDLLEYQENVITLDVLDLPLDAEVSSDAVIVVPYFRSGLSAEFSVQPFRGALLSIVFDDNEPAPAGATVTVVGTDRKFPVAFRGEVFVKDIDNTTRFELRWRNQGCQFTVTLPIEGGGPIPRLGPIKCSGVQR